MFARRRRPTRSMPSKSSDPQKRLLHIRDNIYLARTFVDGVAYEAFRDNQPRGLWRLSPKRRGGSPMK